MICPKHARHNAVIMEWGDGEAAFCPEDLDSISMEIEEMAKLEAAVQATKERHATPDRMGLSMGCSVAEPPTCSVCESAERVKEILASLVELGRDLEGKTVLNEAQRQKIEGLAKWAGEMKDLDIYVTTPPKRVGWSAWEVV